MSSNKDKYAPLSSKEGQRQLKEMRDKNRADSIRRAERQEKESLDRAVRTLPKLGKVSKRGRKAKQVAMKKIDQYVKSQRPKSSWIRALKEANKGKDWCVPKKGSDLYKEVKMIQSRIDKKDAGVTKKNPAGLKKVKRGKKVSKKQKKALEEIREKRKKKQIEI